jgi:hypothetical protein
VSELAAGSPLAEDWMLELVSELAAGLQLAGEWLLELAAVCELAVGLPLAWRSAWRSLSLWL